MYNILIFGLLEERENLIADFSSMACRFLRVNSSAEFYSTAFSRVFDVWLIESTHPEFSELVLHELIATRNTPHIFLFTANGLTALGLTDIHSSKVSVLTNKDIGRCGALFSQLMGDIREQNRERYLAGYIQAQPGREAIVTKSPLMEQLAGPG